MELLQSGMLNTGTKFIISDRVKNPTFIPGTMGFISCFSSLDDSYQNVVNVNTVLIRKGKTGKDRIEFARLKIPIFTFDSKTFLKIMPTTENRKNFVYIEEEGNQYENLMDISALNFAGWATAMANKLKLMSSKCKHSKWPTENKNPVNRMLRLPDYFREDPPAYLESHSNEEFRQFFLRNVRNMYSSMVKIHLDLDRSKVKCELNASEFLEFTNKGRFLEKKETKNEYKFTDDDALIERTTKYYKTVKKDIDKLCTTKTKKGL